MPRTARLDIAGVLQHVMVRGIERRDIFTDDDDRLSFLDRFANLSERMGMTCLAWALMSNHVHLLLRPTQNDLGHFMRRLLTGHAVKFNLRHHRNGHLFQNRYKSIICEEEPYLLELVRYIHLNPLRAGLVSSIEELNFYPWCGHSVLMGQKELPMQQVDEILQYFSKRRKPARAKYLAFVTEGIDRGKRAELVGGGLRRVLRFAGDDFVSAYDDRILGSGDFVEHLRHGTDITERLESRPSLTQLIQLVANAAGIKQEALCQRRRGAALSEAKSIICYLATRRYGYSGEAVAKSLGISRSVCVPGSITWRGSTEKLGAHGYGRRVSQLINYVPLALPLALPTKRPAAAEQES